MIVNILEQFAVILTWLVGVEFDALSAGAVLAILYTIIIGVLANIFI